MATATLPNKGVAASFVAALMDLPESKRSGRFSVRFPLPAEMKFIMTPPLMPEHHPPVISGWTPGLGVRDLIPGGSTTAAGVWYTRETSFTNRAAAVAPPNLKPGSDATYDGHVSPVATIAHWMKLSKQLMDDAPAMVAQINTRLLYFLKVAEDLELLTGTGISGHTDGLLPAAIVTTGAVAQAAPGALLDNIGKSIVEINAAGYITTGIVLNPSDWASIVQLKAGGLYLFLQPGEVTQPTIWNMPVIITPAMPIGQFLCGDFQRGAQVFDREDASIMVSNQNQDDFVKDLMTVLAEERLAQAVYQPGAFRKGS